MMKIILLSLCMIGFATAQERPMTTDRPDKTESAFTLAPSVFQFETTIYAITKDESDSTGEKIENRLESIGDFQIRAGVSENSEIQLLMPAYQFQREERNGSKSYASGAGDLTLRYRKNLMGNESEGPFAWAVMPYLKLPTGAKNFTNDMAEGGVMFPLAMKISELWSLGSMLNIGSFYTSEEDKRRTDYITTLSLSRSLSDTLSSFFEIYSQTSDDQSLGAISTFDLGVTWQQTPDVQWDVGAYLGLTEDADDQSIFTGVAIRF